MNEPVTPDTIRRQVVLEEHDASSDGRFAIVVRRSVEGDAYRSHLWLVALDADVDAGSRSAARPLTHGPVRDTQPRISPDGRRVCFRRAAAPADAADADPEAVARLMILPLDGGEPFALPTGPRAPGEAEWSPDGQRVAYVAETDPPRHIVGAERKGRSPTARRITRIDWRYDGSGHLDRWEHLHVIGAEPDASPRQLTRGDFSVSGIAWHPDGRSLAYAADPRADADVRPRTSIWQVALDGGESREVLALGREVRSPSWSPDGRWLAAVGWVEADALDDVASEVVVVRADTPRSDPTASVVRLAPSLDRPIGSWVDTDLTGWSVRSTEAPAWADGRTLVALVSDRGASLPWCFGFDPDGGVADGEPMPVVARDTQAACVTLRVSSDAPGGPLVSVVSTLDADPPELRTAALSGGNDALRTTTDLGGEWRQGLAWPAMRRLSAPGPGGAIDVWVCSPADAGDAPLPTVVHVHGGPLGAWTGTPSMDDVILCSAGYRVLLPNIRGSATYGKGWIRPQLGDWGGVDAADVLAAVDHAVAVGLADPGRLGLLGLSYGGFMVNWLVGTSDRFRAAVSENGVANQISDWANSDVGVEYDRVALLGDVFSEEGVRKLWRQSPLRHVTSMRTPLLMLQAEADLRCPPADNEQLFIALRVLGREVEYVLYPEESHVYSVTGRPDRRVDRMARMLEWFERHLDGEDGR